MGKATRWFKSLLGMKKEVNNNQEKEKSFSNNPTKENNKRWSFHKPNTTIQLNNSFPKNNDSNAWLRSYIADTEREFGSKHAIAMAAATARAADAAVVAAQAAVAVVRLTERRRGRGREYDEREAVWGNVVKVQSVFRGFLARKALRALKGLVKIQALVRGYLVRKRAAATLYSMQALFRAQASARSQRARRSINKETSSVNEFRSRRSTERFDEVRSEFHSKRLSTSYENSLSPFEESPKIVEIDTYKPRARSRRMSTPILEYNEDPYYQENSSPLPCPFTSKISTSKSKNIENYEWGLYGDDYKFSTAQSTPRFKNSYKNNRPPTPSKSVCGDSLFRPYSNSPSYMANTQSFRAKLRSQSAPRQRVEIVSKRKMSLEEIMASRSSLSGVKMQRSCSRVQETLKL